MTLYFYKTYVTSFTRASYTTYRKRLILFGKKPAAREELEKILKEEAKAAADLILEMPENHISGHMGVEPSRKAKRCIRELEQQFSVNARDIFIKEIQRTLRTREFIVLIQLVGFY